MSYIDKIDISTVSSTQLEGTISQIAYFGQNPHALFKKAHPKKNVKILSEIIPKENKHQKIVRED